MMRQQPTYVFQDGKAYAVVGRQVVAAADTIDDLEKKVADIHGFGEMPQEPTTDMDAMHAEGLSPHPGELAGCPECGNPNLAPGDEMCPHCGAPNPTFEPGRNPWAGHEPNDHGPMDSDPYDNEPGFGVSGHPHMGKKEVVTPNGLRGTVLGKTKDLWGDTVTVRFSNGRIVQLPVTPELKIASVEEKVEGPTTIEKLEKTLTASVDGTRESLSARRTELTQTKRGATDLLRQGAAHADLDRLHNIVVQSDYELQEVGDAMEHLDQAEPFIPTAPFEPHAVEQEGIGHGDSTWLDDAINEMVVEAEGTNYDQLMDEGPEAFAAGLDTPVLADGGAVREIASRFIRSKTAGTEEEVRDKYEKIWLSRVEQVRRSELEGRKEVQRKEATVEQEEPEGPDEGLFT